MAKKGGKTLVVFTVLGIVVGAAAGLIIANMIAGLVGGTIGGFIIGYVVKGSNRNTTGGVMPDAGGIYDVGSGGGDGGGE